MKLQPSFRHPLLGASLVLLFLLISFQPGNAQQTTRYVYDENGRLRAVIAPTGEAAIYEYDPVGNITAIRRLAADALELLSFSPKIGSPLDRVTIYGAGIGNGLVSVSFNGVPARVLSSSSTSIAVEVPTTATTGPITIVTARGSVSTTPFTVRGLGITPATALADATDRVQFRAFVANLSGAQTVQWAVNGVGGGNNTVGTISSGGLYVAPLLPNDVQRRDFTIRATSVSDPDLFREAIVTVRGLNGVLGLAASSVAVYLTPSGNSALTRATPYSSLSVYLTPSGDSALTRATPYNSLSVYLTPSGSSALTTATPYNSLSVYLTPNGGTAFTTVTPYNSVAVTTGPYIDSIAPANLTRGVPTNITVNGRNLSGAVLLTFAQSNSTPDTTITASNISVNGAGTQLTATITVGSNTTIGKRLLIVATANSISPTFDTGVNTLNIVTP